MFHILTLSIWVRGQVIYFFAEFTVLKNNKYSEFTYMCSNHYSIHTDRHSILLHSEVVEEQILALAAPTQHWLLCFVFVSFFLALGLKMWGWYFQIYEKLQKYYFYYANDCNLDERQPKAKCVSLVCKGHVGPSIAWGYGTMTDDDVFTQIQVRVDDCLQKMAIP